MKKVGDEQLMRAAELLRATSKLLSEVSILVRGLAQADPRAVALSRRIEHHLREPLLADAAAMARQLQAAQSMIDDAVSEARGRANQEIEAVRQSVVIDPSGLPAFAAQVRANELRIIAPTPPARERRDFSEQVLVRLESGLRMVLASPRDGMSWLPSYAAEYFDEAPPL